jgi:hypothetical protein
MATRTYYCWKLWVKFEDEDEARLIDPWGDPFLYETPFNFQFDTVKEARLCKASDDFGPSGEETDWVLVKIEETVVVL